MKVFTFCLVLLLQLLLYPLLLPQLTTPTPSLNTTQQWNNCRMHRWHTQTQTPTHTRSDKEAESSVFVPSPISCDVIDLLMQKFDFSLISHFLRQMKNRTKQCKKRCNQMAHAYSKHWVTKNPLNWQQKHTAEKALHWRVARVYGYVSVLRLAYIYLKASSASASSSSSKFSANLKSNNGLISVKSGKFSNLVSGNSSTPLRVLHAYLRRLHSERATIPLYWFSFIFHRISSYFSQCVDFIYVHTAHSIHAPFVSHSLPLSFTHISHTMYTCSCSISIVSLRFTTSSFIHSLYFSRARCDFNLLLPHIVYTKHWYQRVCAPVLRSHTITRSVANMLFARVYGYVTFCLATKLSNLILLNGVQFVCLPFSLRWQWYEQREHLTFEKREEQSSSCSNKHTLTHIVGGRESERKKNGRTKDYRIRSNKVNFHSRAYTSTITLTLCVCECAKNIVDLFLLYIYICVYNANESMYAVIYIDNGDVIQLWCKKKNVAWKPNTNEWLETQSSRSQRIRWLFFLSPHCTRQPAHILV